jgi:hypothetical protein
MKHLDIINSGYFKELLGIEDIGSDRIVKWSPNSVHVLRDIKDDKAIIQAFFWRWNHVLNKLDLIMPSMFNSFNYRFATDTFGNALNEMGMLGTATSVWADARNETSGNLGSFWMNTSGAGLGAQWDGANYRIQRAWFHYDTASIPDNVISKDSAFIRLPGTTTNFENGNTTTFDIVQSTVVSDDTLVSGDFDLRGTTVWGELALSSWNQSGNNDVPFNATGLGNISHTGYSKFAMTNSRDTDNSAPTAENNATFDPTEANQLLSVTYTMPEVGGGFIYMSN